MCQIYELIIENSSNKSSHSSLYQGKLLKNKINKILCKFLVVNNML